MSNARRARFTERERFSYYLRTGRMLPEFKSEPEGAEEAATLETKFNPYHDLANGRFTFAPGGPRSLSHVTTSWGRHGRAGAARPGKPQTVQGRRIDVPIPPAQPTEPEPAKPQIDGPDIVVTARRRDDETEIMNPTGKGVRSDAGGDGRFGASRIRRNRQKYPSGKGPHEGVDLLSDPGQEIIAPVSGKLRSARPGTVPFGGVEISSGDGDVKVKMFYLKPDERLLGKAVKAGDVIRIAQDLHIPGSHYGSTVQNHIHVEVRLKDKLVDPQRYIRVSE